MACEAESRELSGQTRIARTRRSGAASFGLELLRVFQLSTVFFLCAHLKSGRRISVRIGVGVKCHKRLQALLACILWNLGKLKVEQGEHCCMSHTSQFHSNNSQKKESCLWRTHINDIMQCNGKKWEYMLGTLASEPPFDCP
jgi:hypothetical protein